MLKWLALLFMTIDHIGYYFYPVLPIEVYTLMRCIGRLAFPIFAFYLVMGFTRTRNPFRYLYRMASWALIAHFSISVVSFYTGVQTSIWSLEWTNIMVLFTFAITMLMGYDLAIRSYHDMIVSMTPVSDPPFKLKQTHYDVKVNLGGISLSPRIGIPFGIAIILVSFWAVFALNADYGFYGLLTVFFIYLSYKKEEAVVSIPMLLFLLFVLNAGYITLAAMTRGNIPFALIQSLSMFSIFLFPIVKKDTKRPGFLGKYFFYFYYPAHIVIILLLARYWENILKLFR